VNVKYRDIEDGYHYANMGGGLDTMAVVQKSTGKCFYRSDDLVDDDWPSDEDLDTDDYVVLPDKFDLDLGQKLVFDFVLSNVPDDYERVRDMFRRRGAYGRFKGLLHRKGLLDAWFACQNKSEEAALRQWCEREGIELED